jgi:HlyD family secretion protein
MRNPRGARGGDVSGSARLRRTPWRDPRPAPAHEPGEPSLSQRQRRLAAPVATLLGAVFACGGGNGDLVVVGIVERTAAELAAPVSEVIVDVAVYRGERVEPGQVLVRLDPTLTEAEVARAEAALASARTSDRVSVSELKRIQRLRRQRVASEQDLERAELMRDEAAARLREAVAVLAASRKRVEDLTLRAPTAGVVDQLPYEVGERVPAGAVLAVVLEEADPWVRVWIPETHVAELAPGAPAEVRIDGVPGELAGRVLDIAREPSFTPHYALTERDRVHLVYETRVQIVDPPPVLRPGMPAEIRFVGKGGAR